MTTPHDPSLDRPARNRRRTRAGMRLLIVLLPVLALGLVGCPPPPDEDRIDVTVLNLCVGPDYHVRVYINHRYEGVVTVSQTFRGVRAGLVQLRAVGIEDGGSTYLHDRIAYDRFTWTLCGPEEAPLDDDEAPDPAHLRKAE